MLNQAQQFRGLLCNFKKLVEVALNSFDKVY